MQTINLNQLAIALLGAGAYIYQCARYWKACAIVCGTRIERNHPDPYAALAAVAQVLIEYDARQAAQDAHDTPAARAAYRATWAATQGQPVPARFAAAEAAAAASHEQPDNYADDPEGYDVGPYGEGDEDNDDSGRDYEQELTGDFYSQAFD